MFHVWAKPGLMSHFPITRKVWGGSVGLCMVISISLHINTQSTHYIVAVSSVWAA
jgi:hypothetical protein